MNFILIWLNKFFLDLPGSIYAILSFQYKNQRELKIDEERQIKN